MRRVDNSSQPSRTPSPTGQARTGSTVLEPSGDHQASNFVKQEGTSSLMQSQMKDMKPTKWTDEKHSLYLNSMEASFVHQLHNALDLHGRHSLKCATSQPKPISQKHTRRHNPSGQFKIFQDGSWHKIAFCQGQPELNKADESGLLSSNPWIQHYRSGCRQNTRAFPSSQEEILANVKDDFPASKFHLCHEDEAGSKTGRSNLSLEGTDQNFADEDPNEEVKGRAQSKKRMKKTAVNLPGQDQVMVVPLGKFSYTEDVAENDI